MAMIKPRTTLVIANETGIGTSTAAMRATIRAIRTIVRIPMTMPRKLSQALTPALPSPSGPRSNSTSCQFKKLMIRRRTLATNMSCVPRPSACNLSMRYVLSSWPAVSRHSDRRAPELQAARRTFVTDGVGPRS